MLSYYFPPTGAGGVQRSLKFAKYLPRFGMRVTVVTPKPIAYLAYDYTLAQEIPASVKVVTSSSGDPARLVAILRGIKSPADSTPQSVASKSSRGIHGAKLYQWFKRWFALPDPEVLWLPFAYYAAKREITQNKVSAIYSTSPPSSTHLLGYFIKRESGLPWVADFRDFWVDHYDFARRRWHIKFLMEGMEKAVFKYADRIICNTPGMLNLYKAKYPAQSSKLLLIPNGYDEEDFGGLMPAQVQEGCRRLVHMGTLRGDRSLLGVMEAIRLANAELPSPSRWILEQLGTYHDYIATELRSKGLLEDVRFIGNLPHREALARGLSADALLLLVSPGEGSALIPAKLYEYLRLGRPIIVVAPPGDATDLAINLANAAAFSPAGVQPLATYLKSGTLDAPRINREELAHFGRNNLTRDLFDTICEISSHNSCL